MIELRGGGRLLHAPCFLNASEADVLFHQLLEQVPWRQESGRFGPMPRLTAWYADAGRSYSYSGVTHIGLEWIPPLVALKHRLEATCEASFNSALLNRYRDGRDSMGWHADNERELGINPAIASVSLGSARRFRLKHLQTGETLEFDLSHGSLLLMAGTTQHHWQHAVPKSTRSVGERINVTFREIVA